MTERLWKEKDTAFYLGCVEGTLRKARSVKTEFSSLPFIKLGSAVRYDPDAVKAWVKQQAESANA